jgi:methylated-DNA-[protein]-cysteine S-methyltransferase
MTDATFESTPSTESTERAELARLHDRLVADAAHDGLIDLAYRTIDTPIGALLLVATDGGLVRVAFELEGHDAVLETLAARISPRILHAPDRLDAVARELDQYFDRRRQVFGIDVDLRLVRGFRRDVLAQLRAIPFGQTRSYGAVATATGHPGASRAVGTACATNPIPIVVPCHRVVRSDGSVGQYAGGAPAKHLLLDLEART